MEKRFTNIDIARAFAITLVVCGHCDNFTGWSIEKFSNLFFLPLFVFISGFLFKSKQIINIKDLCLLIFKRVKKLYLIYVKWELIFLALRNLLIKINFYSLSTLYGGKNITFVTSIRDFLTNVLKILLLMGREPFCGACWFLVTLIIIVIIFYSIYFVSLKCKKKDLTVFVLVLIFFIIGCIMHYTISVPRISPAFTLLLFYYLGYLYQKHIELVKFNNVFIAVGSFLLLFVLQKFGFVALNNNNFKDPLFLIVTSILGIYFFFYISNRITLMNNFITKILAYIGKNSISIVVLHLFSFKLVMCVQLFLGIIDIDHLSVLTGYNNNNIFYLFYILCGVGFPLLFYKISITANIERFIKNRYNERKGI